MSREQEADDEASAPKELDVSRHEEYTRILWQWIDFYREQTASTLTLLEDHQKKVITESKVHNKKMVDLLEELAERLAIEGKAKCH